MLLVKYVFLDNAVVYKLHQLHQAHQVHQLHQVHKLHQVHRFVELFKFLFNVLRVYVMVF